MRTPRTLTVAGVLAGGAATAVGLGYAGRTVLHRQAATARRLIGKPLGEDAPAADRVWRRKHGGPREPLDLLLLGDSVAAGLGAHRRKDTLGGRLAKGLGAELGCAVRLRTAAVVGAESSTLADQLASLPPAYVADLAVVVVGGNDVTHRVPVARAAADLGSLVAALRARGTVVVVGTCPDLGALRPVPQPLRTLGSRASRQLARAQEAAVVTAGGRAVSLARVMGPLFHAEPETMFALDRFHPSALGYRRTAAALLPTLLQELEHRSEEAAPPAVPRVVPPVGPPRIGS